jgi:hypothetical protein
LQNSLLQNTGLLAVVVILIRRSSVGFCLAPAGGDGTSREMADEVDGTTMIDGGVIALRSVFAE